MNSYNLHQDYGPSTFDNRNVLNGFVYYSVPQIGHFAPRLTKGFQLNAIYTYTTGTPISPQYSTNVDGTGELKDRPNFTGVSPYVGGAQLATSTSHWTFVSVISKPRRQSIVHVSGWHRFSYKPCQLHRLGRNGSLRQSAP